ncbi:hypothetical protein RRF57_008684 [Xylaria bambusicola]|uniref:Uncharacterized protein n=1 Tax=Xylaria bambusicola TaxID=326684 RepID=A0AAN7UIA5_9PEZI
MIGLWCYEFVFVKLLGKHIEIIIVVSLWLLQVWFLMNWWNFSFFVRMQDLSVRTDMAITTLTPQLILSHISCGVVICSGRPVFLVAIPWITMCVDKLLIISNIKWCKGQPFL